MGMYVAYEIIRQRDYAAARAILRRVLTYLPNLNIRGLLILWLVFACLVLLLPPVVSIFQSLSSRARRSTA